MFDIDGAEQIIASLLYHIVYTSVNICSSITNSINMDDFILFIAILLLNILILSNDFYENMYMYNF